MATRALPHRTALCLSALSMLTGVAAGAPPADRGGSAVSDRTVAARVAALQTPADHEALAAYYRGKAAEQDPFITYYEQLFDAYMKLEGKVYEPLRRHARALLKSSRLLKRHYELLAGAHLRMAHDARANQ